MHTPNFVYTLLAHPLPAAHGHASTGSELVSWLPYALLVASVVALALWKPIMANMFGRNPSSINPATPGGNQ